MSADNDNPDPNNDDDLDQNDHDNDGITEDEILADLKNRATQLGISFHSSIKQDALRLKIMDFMEKNEGNDNQDDDDDDNSSTDTATAAKKRTRGQVRNDALKLVRVHITPMDPLKKNHDGEIITAGNTVIGTVRKMVRYGRDFHLPNIIYQFLKSKMYQQTYEETNDIGQKVRRSREVPAYSINLLPDLTDEELKDLRQRQAKNAGTA